MKSNLQNWLGHLYIIQPPLLKLFYRYYRGKGFSKGFKLYSKDNLITPNFRIAQFFFTSECAKDLVDRLDRFDNPCCLCTPRLGKEWFDRGRVVRVLDIDKRFSFLPGYKYYDLRFPTIVIEVFDVIVMDPIFKYGDAVLLNAINNISKENYDQKLLIVHTTADSSLFLRTFSDYKLQPTGYHPEFCNLTGERNKMYMFYANFEFP